ncbi:MAG: YceI family protein [Phycisphaerales bacterium]|nr:YceI family protein [Phycisphaerales bacterium]
MRIRTVALTTALAVPGLFAALLVGPTIADRTVEATAAPVAEPLPDMPEGSYKIDAVHSTALFRVQHMGAGNFWGRFNDVQGRITYTPSDDKKTFEFDVKIPIDSVDSGNDRLDKHLKSPDFFNSKEHDLMSFKSTEIERISQDVWDVSGKLTINGVTKEIVALVRFISTADLGRGHRAGFEATFDIKRSDFNMSYGVKEGTLGDMTHVVVAMEVGHEDS